MSPRIPSYESRVGLPETAGTVQAPAGAATLPAEAAAKGFGQLSDVGFRIDSELTRAAIASGVSKATADASVLLNDMRNRYLSSPEFNLDPEGTKAAYLQEIETLHQNTSKTLGDSHARTIFDENFNKLAGSHVVQFSNDVRKARVNLVQGETLASVNGFINAAASAPDERTYHENIKGIYGALGGAVASGAIPMDQAERMREHSVRTALLARANAGLLTNPQQVLSEISAKQGVWSNLPELDRANLMEASENRVKALNREARVGLDAKLATAAYSQVWKTFQLGNGGDVSSAIKWLDNPENAQAVGLVELDQVRQVQNQLYTQVQHDQAMKDLGDKQRAEKFSQAALENFVGGKLTIPDVLKADVPFAVKEHWIKNIDLQGKQEEREDPKVYSDVLAKIWSREITDVGQLVPYLGAGLSGKSAKGLSESIKQAQEPVKSQWVQMSRDLYKAKYKGDAEMEALLPDFLNNLDWHVKSENLKGQAIFDRAKELMTPLEENRWWKFWQSEEAITPTFQREIKEQPWKGSPPPATDPRVKDRIDQLRTGGMGDDEIANHLKGVGIDPAAYGLK